MWELGAVVRGWGREGRTLSQGTAGTSAVAVERSECRKPHAPNVLHAQQWIVNGWNEWVGGARRNRCVIHHRHRRLGGFFPARVCVFRHTTTPVHMPPWFMCCWPPGVWVQTPQDPLGLFFRITLSPHPPLDCTPIAPGTGRGCTCCCWGVALISHGCAGLEEGTHLFYGTPTLHRSSPTPLPTHARISSSARLTPSRCGAALARPRSRGSCLPPLTPILHPQMDLPCVVRSTRTVVNEASCDHMRAQAPPCFFSSRQSAVGSALSQPSLLGVLSLA
jgi:hypothetical protein